MIRIVTLTFVIAMGIVLGGCNSMNKPTAAAPQADVLNVAAAPAPSATPLAPPSAISDAPIAMAAPAQMSAAPAPMTNGINQSAEPTSKTYTVKKGDTLFGIAKLQMGSGRDWQKLVSANPGLDPKKLKVGQTITIPS